MRTLPVVVALLLGVACGPRPQDLPALIADEETRDAVRLAIEGHGGLAAFRNLHDIEYEAIVEQYDATGALQVSTRELHRFETVPPRRYVRRRSGTRVSEVGLDGEEGWARVDGRSIERPEAGAQARRELALLALLNRLPFSLADPGFSLGLLPDVAGTDGSPSLLRITAERDNGPPAERYVVLIDASTGLVHEVIFESVTGDGSLRTARAENIKMVNGVRLVTRWAFGPADSTGRPSGIHDSAWIVDEIHADNGFTDELYRAARPAGPGDGGR
ncbi:MAG: hypothetical protein ACE5IK_03710 [Acidobacteriota bacterium]